MSYRVYKSADGRVFIRSKEERFTASFKQGIWSSRIAFSGNELEELCLVTDEQLANSLILQAQEAVG